VHALLTWVDQIGQLGNVLETDSKLLIELGDEVFDMPGVAILLVRDDLLFQPEVFLQVSPSGRPAQLLPELPDFELPEGLMPCPSHEIAYANLLRQQANGRNVTPRSRLTLLRAMRACSDCSLRLTLWVVIDKERHFKQHTLDTWPLNVDCKLWFYPALVAAKTETAHYLTWKPQPLVLCIWGAAPLQSEYVTCVDLSAEDFMQRAVLAAADLAPKAEALTKRLKGRPLTGLETWRILPRDYWVNQEVLVAERFPPLLPLPGLFFMSLMGQVCDRVTREPGDIYLFEADGARPLSVRCELTRSGVVLDGVAHELTPALAGQLLHFYRKAVRGKPQGQNLDLLQQAVRMAGDAKLSSLVTGMAPIEAYYDFQWKALARSQFKEQIALVKSYLGGVQTARGKVSAAMDELHKNLTTVVSGAAAVAAVLLTAAVTKNAQIYDYLILAGVLMIFPYIPIHVLRASSLVAAAERDVAQFQADLELSAKELGFPLQILDVGMQVDASRALLRDQVRTTSFWLGIVALLCEITALVAYSLGQSSVKKLLPPWLVLLLILGAGAVPIWMLVRFWRRHGAS
jgi:hypothetical protein